MRKRRSWLSVFLVFIALPLPLTATELTKSDRGRILYVRQTVGDDANDGLSPQTAWRTLSMLGEALRAGDTAFVGPGLYREMLTLGHSGAAEQPITLIADATGERTTDPPGVVMITGADPVDETIFVAEPTPGVYKATDLKKLVMNAVEMDGPQYRYPKAFDTTEHIREGMSQREVVNKKPSTVFYDRETKVVYIHTSDGRPPATHEIELIRRNYGIVTYGKQHVRVIGFTFRHMGTAGLNFQDGSHHCIAIDNKSYGSWQGIRVFGSNDVVVADNELFRNSNSGIYISLGSSGGYAIGNILYENSKGVRWSSDSVNGLALRVSKIKELCQPTRRQLERPVGPGCRAEKLHRAAQPHSPAYTCRHVRTTLPARTPVAKSAEFDRFLGGDCASGEVTIKIPYDREFDPIPIRDTVEWYLFSS